MNRRCCRGTTRTVTYAAVCLERTLSALNSTSPERPVAQKYLGPTGLIILMALPGAFVTLSTDLYLIRPACLPGHHQGNLV
jgi:hypothetical protein